VQCACAKRRGIRLGALSDYPAAEKLAALGIGKYFDAVVSSQDREVGLLKPHPRGLMNCLQQLDVEPGRCIYIGDRVDVDLPCAMNAHTRFVLFGNAPFPAHCWAVSSYRQLIDSLGFTAPAEIPERQYVD
jgi:FMN phosphatase YigB (HAD superfamily)